MPRRTPKTTKPKPPRLISRGEGTERKLNGLAARVKTWRLVVEGVGGTMAQSWRTSVKVGVAPDDNAWVLKVSDHGDLDDDDAVPKALAVAALLDPDTGDEDAIVQRLLDASSEWFNIDELHREGTFAVRYPGFP